MRRLEQAMNTRSACSRVAGGTRRRSAGETIPGSEPAVFNNVTVGGGPAPVRAYIGTSCGRSCGQYRTRSRVRSTVALDGVRKVTATMNDREAIKVMVTP